MLASLAVLGSSSTCFFNTANLAASFGSQPLCFTSPASSAAIWLFFIFDGCFSGFFDAVSPTSCFLDFPGASPVSSAAALDEDAACFGAGVLDLSRCAVLPPANGAGGSDCIRRPRPLKGVGASASLDSRARPVLRPLAGLGATMTSMGGVVGFDFDLSLFVGLLSAGGTVVVSAAALDELDAAPGVREALLLLALALAVGGCAEGSLLLGIGVAAAALASAASAVSTIAATVRLGSKDIHGATGRRTSASAESAVTSVVKVALVRVSASASAAVAVEVVAIMIGMTRGSRRLGRG